MNSVQYPEDIQKDIQLAESLYESEPARAIPLIHSLLQRTEVYHDLFLRASLFYNMGSAYFDLKNTRQSARCMGQAIGYFKRLEEWERLAQCYNVLGICYTYQGDNATSIEALINELELAETHDMQLYRMKAYINLADTCYEISHMDEAMSYSKKALEIFGDNEDLEQVVNYWIVYLTIHVKALVRKGRLKDAEQTLMELDNILKTHPQFAGTPFDALPRLQFSLAAGSGKPERGLMDKTMETFMAPGIVDDFIFETIEFMGNLEQVGAYEELHTILPFLEKALDPTDYYGYKMAHSRFKIDYCRHVHDTAALVKEIGNYCNYVDQQRDVSSEGVMAYLRVRTSLRASDESNRQLQQSNLLLRQKANTDELTGLWNRRGLNEAADRSFDQAKEKGQCFAFEILDIDFFKTVNDQHGHAEGDRCLVMIADLLKGIIQPNVFSARYGGDEFVLLFRDKSDEELLHIAEQLRQQVIARAAQIGLPPVTISQGICNRVPFAKDRVWDFSSTADKALYQVKENGRNGIVLLHR